jgi:hypothetical protein
LVKTYFKYYRKPFPEILLLKNIYNSNTSFIIYETILSHIKDCNHCKYCKDILKFYDCNEFKGILYPYGNYITSDTVNGIYLHSRFNINDWCISCKPELPCHDVTEDNSINDNNGCNCDEIPYTTNCNSCSKKNTTKKESFYMFPSQNSFVYGNDSDSYEKKQRMNAYAVYPNIRNCLPNLETKTDTNVNKKEKLCKATKPLFI